MLSLIEISRKIGSFLAITALAISVAVLFLIGYEPFAVVAISLIISFSVYLLIWGLFAILGEQILDAEVAGGKEKKISSEITGGPDKVEASVRSQSTPRIKPVHEADEVESVGEAEPLEEAVEEEELASESGQKAVPENIIATIISQAKKEEEERNP